jgi:hypothetical protein
MTPCANNGNTGPWARSLLKLDHRPETAVRSHGLHDEGTPTHSDFMQTLKPHQHELLVELVRRGRLPAEQVDGRVLRALRTHGLAEASGEWVVATRAGKQRVDGQATKPLPVHAKLNEKQEGLLRTILRQQPLHSHEVDGRVIRPLIARGLVTLREDYITPTNAGRTYFDEQQPSPKVRGRKRVENARAAVIRRASQRLEAAIPPGSEVLVGNIMASADDLVNAFRRHARKLEQNRSK